MSAKQETARTRISLIRRKPRPESRLISLRDAAAILCCDESSIRKGLCGFDRLTLVRRGTGKYQRILLVREEVEDFVREEIERAQRLQELTQRLVFGT